MTTQALKTHITFPSFAKDLKSEAGVVPLSYSHTELSQILISNASQSILPRLTEAQHQLIKQIQEDDRFYDVKEVKSVLEEIFIVLDNAFYFGQLKSRIDMYIKTQPSAETLEDDPLTTNRGQGFFTAFWTDIVERGSRTPQKLCPKDGQKCGILMNLFNTPIYEGTSVAKTMLPEKFTQSQLRFWIGVLAHEMLHGFFDIFICECWKKCRTKVIDTFKGIGCTGHGLTFCESLDAIQVQCTTEIGVGADAQKCGIDVAVYTEMEVSGWEPTDSQIQRWSLRRDLMSNRRMSYETVVLDCGWDRRAIDQRRIEEWLSEYSWPVSQCTVS